MAVYKVNPGGKAPTGLSDGDQVVTGGGTYKITGTNPDGTYKSELLDEQQTLDSYTGEYTSAPGAKEPNGLNDTDWYGQFLSGLKNGADYDTLNSYYRNRLAKSSPGSEYEQYADDDAMGFMQRYLNGMQQNDVTKQIQDAIAMIQSQDYSYAGSEWDSKLDELARAAIDFNYSDWANSDQYKSLADRYGQQGALSMQDVLGQISSRTGGLASSYATTVAQQQYNDYMAQLEGAARNQFANEKNTMLDNASLARDMSEADYQRYLDDLSVKQSTQGTALSTLYDLLGIHTEADNTDYTRDQTAKIDAQNRIYDYLVNQGGSVGDLEANLITTSGYTTAELNAMEAKYKELAAANNGGIGGTPGVLKDDDPTPANGMASLDYDEDEGIFTWNGKQYSSINTMLEEMENTKISDDDKKILTDKLDMFGWDVVFPKKDE